MPRSQQFITQCFSVRSGAVTLKGAAKETKPAVAGYDVEVAQAAFAPIASGFSLWANREVLFITNTAAWLLVMALGFSVK